MVIDPPEVPVNKVVRGKRDILMPPIFGMVAGAFFSTFALVLLWRLDRVVRLPSDLAAYGPNVPVVALPALKTRRKTWPASFVRLATAVQSGVWPRQVTPASPATDVTAPGAARS